MISILSQGVGSKFRRHQIEVSDPKPYISKLQNAFTALFVVVLMSSYAKLYLIRTCITHKIKDFLDFQLENPCITQIGVEMILMILTD